MTISYHCQFIITLRCIYIYLLIYGTKNNPQQKEITAKKTWAKPDLTILDKGPINGGGVAQSWYEIAGTRTGHPHALKNTKGGITWANTNTYNLFQTHS